jgi:hypothetical protein
MQELFSSSQWLHGLRRGSAAARLLGLWVRGHGHLSLVNVVCCQVEVSVSGWSIVQRSPTECGVSECDHKQWGGPTPLGLLRHGEKKINRTMLWGVTCPWNFIFSVAIWIFFLKTCKQPLVKKGSNTTFPKLKRGTVENKMMWVFSDEFFVVRIPYIEILFIIWHCTL